MPEPPKSILKKPPQVEESPLVLENLEVEKAEIATAEETSDPVLCEIEKKISDKSGADFDYMNGDQFTDNSTVRDLKTTLVEPSVVDDNTSTKSGFGKPILSEFLNEILKSDSADESGF